MFVGYFRGAFFRRHPFINFFAGADQRCGGYPNLFLTDRYFRRVEARQDERDRRHRVYIQRVVRVHGNKGSLRFLFLQVRHPGFSLVASICRVLWCYTAQLVRVVQYPCCSGTFEAGRLNYCRVVL